MCSNLIVVRSVSLQNAAQEGFAEHDKVVERFATYRSDEPLDMAVLPRRAWCGRISDPHSTNAAGVRRTECAVAVANHIRMGTHVRVTNLENGKSVVVVVNDHMSVRGKIVMDISRPPCRELQFGPGGEAKVKLEVEAANRATSH